MGKKSWFFNKNNPTDSSSSSPGWTWKQRFFTTSSAIFRFKPLEFQLSMLDDFLFKIVSVIEAVVLVSALCFFFVCCGCHL